MTWVSLKKKGRHEKALEVASSTDLEGDVMNNKDSLSVATEEEILAVSRDYGSGRIHSRTQDEGGGFNYPRPSARSKTH